jgi:hypothetical protein
MDFLFFLKEYKISTTKKYEGVRRYKCAFGDCNNREVMPVVCEKCDLNFCLR